MRAQALWRMKKLEVDAFSRIFRHLNTWMKVVKYLS